MARRWTTEEENCHRKELQKLYILQNKSIFEVARELNINWRTVFARLRRLGIPTIPEKKAHYLHTRHDTRIPDHYSDDLAEFFGIMLGDGCLNPTQIMVTLGTKELAYAHYVAKLIKKIFGALPKISLYKDYKTVYLGCVALVRWLKREGLVFNKVRSQVDVPIWIFTKESFMRRFVRGFFDTDGSVYRLRYGIQVSFTNHSRPLLKSLQYLCETLGYRVSAIGQYHFFITRIRDIERFFGEVAPQNEKHQKRFTELLADYRKKRAGRPVGGGGWL